MSHETRLLVACKSHCLVLRSSLLERGTSLTAGLLCAWLAGPVDHLHPCHREFNHYLLMYLGMNYLLSLVLSGAISHNLV